MAEHPQDAKADGHPNGGERLYEGASMEMSNGPQEPRPIFFEMREESAGFEVSVGKLMARLIAEAVGQQIPLDNHQAYTHGRSWTHPANEFAYQAPLQTQSAEITTPFQDIVNGDYEIIPRMVESLVKQFSEASPRMLYQTVADVSDAAGQTVNARGAPFPEAFLEGLKKVEFGVDRDGNVSKPEIHVGNPKFIEELEAMPPEYHAELERLIAEKTAAALSAEEERRAKFKGRPS